MTLRPEPPSESAEAPLRLSLRSPREIQALPDDPDDNLLGDRLLSKGGSLLLIGPPGCHKSRLILCLAACCVSGRDFFGLPTFAANKRWLMLQFENDNRRLKYDFCAIERMLGPVDFDRFNDKVTVHTLEGEADFIGAMDDPNALARMEAAIDEAQPDIVAVDSIYNVGIGDLNKDADMRKTCFALSQLVKRGNARRAVVALHHSLTGKAAIARSGGWDRGSYSRNSKVLHAWTRGQINVAPGSTDGTSVVLSCGKASNGREFERTAARLDDHGMLVPFPEFNFSAWESELSEGASGRRQSVGINEVVAEANGLTKADLVVALIDKHGIGKSRAYDLVKHAEEAKRIVFSPLTKTFRRH